MKIGWKTYLTQCILHAWYNHKLLLVWLIPLSCLFNFYARKRRTNYKKKQHWHPPIPIIIVGNITVGGTGKTPIVAALVNTLKKHGYIPGIISRGYGGNCNHYPMHVTESTSPSQGGDEPVLLANMLHVPVIVDPDRVQAAQFLCNKTSCDIIVADDGLQHYALFRHIEIVVIDGERLLGNGYTLPAGPLREPATRLKEVDLILINGVPNEQVFLGQSVNYFSLTPGRLKPLHNTQQTPPINGTVHAIAGIGNPQRFFNMLNKLGFTVIPHPFSDHQQYTPQLISFSDKNPVIMTEKDAIKCLPFAQENHWYLPVSASIPSECIDKFIGLIPKM